MPNLGYQLTLASSGIGYGGSSGPYYTVEYSTGSIGIQTLVYSLVISGSPAYLPGVGSTANVIIPSASFDDLTFKLTSLGSCTNEVIYEAQNTQTFIMDFMNITASAPFSDQMGPLDVYSSGSKAYIIGNYICYNSSSKFDMILIDNAGNLDATFNSGTATSGSALNGKLHAFTIQPTTNKVIIGGGFNKWDGVNVAPSASFTSSLLRLNSNGTNDTSFTGHILSAFVGSIPSSVASFTNGELVVGNQSAGLYMTNANGT